MIRSRDDERIIDDAEWEEMRRWNQRSKETTHCEVCGVFLGHGHKTYNRKLDVVYCDTCSREYIDEL